MDKIQARVVLEILGRPPQQVKNSLFLLVDRLSKENGIKVLDKKVHDPIPVKDSPDLFTTFAELTLELDSIDNYFGIMFAYMPSNIEVIHPENVAFNNTDLNVLGNKLIARLHEYDALTKRIIFERDSVLSKLKEVAPHLFPKQEELPANKEKNKKQKKKTKKEK